MSAASRALLADDDDGSSTDAMITPEEMQANVRLARAAVMPPFVQLLQAVLRWSTEHTSRWLQTGRVSQPPPHAATRSRQAAFLQFLQQQWGGIASTLALQRLDASRDLADLTNTLAFEQGPLPPLAKGQWMALTIVALRMVAQRRATEDKRLPPTTHRHSWQAVALFSGLADAPSTAPAPAPAPAPASSPVAAGSSSSSSSSSACATCAAVTSPALLAAVQQLLSAVGLSLEQCDSLFQTMADGGWVQ